MGTSNYSDEFKRDAVHQITVRGYPVREVSRRLGVSTHSLYRWLKLFAESATKPGVDHEAENRRLKREMARVTEERDILRKATVCFARGSGHGAFRSGFSVHRSGMADVPVSAWSRIQHEPAWQLSRQRRRRKLLPASEPRADQAAHLPDARRRQTGRVRRHRDVLQPETQAHEQRHAAAR